MDVLKVALSNLVAVAVFLAASADARVERIEVLSRADVLEGKAFGEARASEKLSGKVHFAVKPEAAPNSDIRREQASSSSI